MDGARCWPPVAGRETGRVNAELESCRRSCVSTASNRVATLHRRPCDRHPHRGTRKTVVRCTEPT